MHILVTMPFRFFRQIARIHDAALKAILQGQLKGQVAFASRNIKNTTLKREIKSLQMSS